MRKIIHLDMDAFYAAVEQRDNPALRGRPVVVGGAPDGRGVVATCSYEARRFGIRSAMPASRAARLCPDAVFLRPRFDVYRRVSSRIQALFREYTSLVEPLSLDEAYLDVSDARAFRGSATLIAGDIRRRVRTDTGLTISAGVSYNKFLAKQASDLDKPDGLRLITPDQGPAFVATLPVGRFHGVGQATERRMLALGIRTGADLRRWTLPALQGAFGKRAQFYHDIARGVDRRPVQGTRVRKSLGAETTFPVDLREPADMVDALAVLAERVAASLNARGLLARTVTLKVKYADFDQISRSRTAREPFRSGAGILRQVEQMLAATEAGPRAVRLLGVTLSALESVSPAGGEQLGWEF